MPTLTPRTFPHLLNCDIISQGAMESHLRLYEGYVEKYNELAEKLQVIQARALPSGPSDAASLKGDMIFALGAIKNHELFFDGIAPADSPTDKPEGDLQAAIARSFHSVPQYLIDLRLTAQRGRGWAFTAYDLDHDTLFNFESAATNGLPVWNTVPILAIDLYGHAYFYDFGTNRLAYVDAVIASLDWQKAATRLATARSKS